MGEGSQIPFTAATTQIRRGLRFVVSCGAVGQADAVVSAFQPDQGNVELMAWDERSGGFNFYRTVGRNAAWVFAGNSRHALSDPTQGKGPFESHPSGSILMKELRAPWSNWDSPDAPVSDSAFGPDDPLRSHPWFTAREPLGAVDCERHVARPSIERWAQFRFDAMQQAGSVPDAMRVLSQIVTSATVNLVSSLEPSLGEGELIDLPATFFVDSEALGEGLGIGSKPTFAVRRSIYASTMARFEVHLTDGNGFSQPGETHFAFLVAERAFEDQQVIVHARRIGLITDRLLACLLMTDFPNPVFSTKRASLLRHAPERAALTDGASSFSDDMAHSILAAAARPDATAGETEFSERWAVGDAWKDRFDRDLLQPYYRGLQARLGTTEGFGRVYQLAESCRSFVRSMPIFENELLFSRSRVQERPRSMEPDGSVTDG